MKIAVSYKDGEIYEHFGHAECFAIYDFNLQDMSQSTKRLIDVTDRHGHEAMAQLMKAEGIDAVLSGSMGGEAKAMLLSFGIVLTTVTWCVYKTNSLQSMISVFLLMLQDKSCRWSI